MDTLIGQYIVKHDNGDCVSVLILRFILIKGKVRRLFGDILTGATPHLLYVDIYSFLELKW